MTHFTCLVGFLFVLPAISTAIFKYTVNCPVIQTVKVDPKMYEGSWYTYIRSSRLGYWCEFFNETNIKDGDDNIEVYHYKFNQFDGTIQEESYTKRTMATPWTNKVEDPDGESILLTYDVAVTDDYWLEYTCGQFRNESLPLLTLSTRGLTAPQEGLDKMEHVNKQYNLNLTFALSAFICTIL